MDQSKFIKDGRRFVELLELKSGDHLGLTVGLTDTYKHATNFGYTTMLQRGENFKEASVTDVRAVASRAERQWIINYIGTILAQLLDNVTDRVIVRGPLTQKKSK